MALTYEIIKEGHIISQNKEITLELNYLKWGNGPAKYDIRKWKDEQPFKGVSLSEDELEKLYYAIGEELGLAESCDSEES